MGKALIGEVIQIPKRELKESSKNQTLNINLNQNIDKRNISNINTTNTYNTYNQQSSQGLFSFLIFAVTLPFKLISSMFTQLDKSFSIKSKLKAEKIKLKKNKYIRKYITSTNEVYDFEEIY